jgi:hypothetical protein
LVRAVGVLEFEDDGVRAQGQARREAVPVEAAALAQLRALRKLDFLTHLVLGCEHSAVTGDVGTNRLFAGGSALANDDDFPVPCVGPVVLFVLRRCLSEAKHVRTGREQAAWSCSLKQISPSLEAAEGPNADDKQDQYQQDRAVLQ